MPQPIVLYGIAILAVSALLQPPTVAEESPQNTWQQPYSPSRLQWLFMNLNGKGERTPCGVYNLDNKPLAWYQWQSPNPKDNQLVLSVFTRPGDADSIADRNFCMMTALSNLKSEALRMENSPPPVELRHFQSNRNTQTPIGIYQCSVPAAKTSVDLDIDRFERICR